MTDRDNMARVSGYLDGELADEEMRGFERDVAADPGLALELERMRAMREVMSTMKLKEFPDQVWDAYVAGTYNRAERRFGWLLFTIGAVILTAGGLYALVVYLIEEPVEWWVLAGLGALILGLAVLFVSVLRERLFVLKRDPYKEVER
jgi:anti-sigma factor RsiW